MKITTASIQKACFAFMAIMISLYNYSDNTALKLITNLSVLLFAGVMLTATYRDFKIPSAFRYLFVFLIFCAVSSFASTAQNDSVNKLVTLSLLFAEMLAVYQLASNREDLDSVLHIMAICTIITAVYIDVKGFGILETSRRVGHVTGDSNQVSAYLVYGIALLIYMFALRKMPRWLAVFGVAASVFAIAIQGSRGAILAAGISIIAEVILLTKYQRLPFSKRLWLFLGLIAVLIGAIYYIMTNPVLYMTLGRRFVSLYELQTLGTSSMNEHSATDRMLAYRLAFERFMSNPIIGRGIGSFSAYSVNSALDRAGFCPNNYLELLQGIGLFGTAAYYLAYLSIYTGSRRRMMEQPLAILAVCILLGMLLEHITVVFYYHKLEYLYLGILFAITMQLTATGEAGEENEENRDNHVS